MALYKLEDFYPQYRETLFEGNDVKGLDVFSGGDSDEHVGTVNDALVDDSGRLRYLVVDTGFWIFGKKILIPIGRCKIDFGEKLVWALNLYEKEQVEEMPEYDDDMTVDYAYEERVRLAQRLPPSTERTSDDVRLAHRPFSEANMYGDGNADPATSFDYDSDPDLYQVNETEHQSLKLYEERLVAHKDRYKTGEIAVSKRVNTDTAEISVPVEKERIVIERREPTDQAAITSEQEMFAEGEVVRMEVHEESANIYKQAFVKEEVTIAKQVDRDSVDATESVRTEELEITEDGHPAVERV